MNYSLLQKTHGQQKTKDTRNRCSPKVEEKANLDSVHQNYVFIFKCLVMRYLLFSTFCNAYVFCQALLLKNAAIYNSCEYILIKKINFLEEGNLYGRTLWHCYLQNNGAFSMTRLV